MTLYQTLRSNLPNLRMVLGLVDLLLLVTVIVALILEFLTDVKVPKLLWGITLLTGLVVILFKGILSNF